MASAKSTAKRQRSTFLYSTEAGTVLALLFAYLNGELSKTFTQREGKGRGINALSAFWMPYALRQQKQVDPLELKQSARSAVEALSRQIRAICQDFEVESPFEGSCSGKQLESLVQALIDRGASLPPAIASRDDRPPTSTPASDDLREVIFVDDEDLLGDLN